MQMTQKALQFEHMKACVLLYCSTDVVLAQCIAWAAPKQQWPEVA